MPQSGPSHHILDPDPVTAEEDDVVFAFLHACPVPSPADVAAWGQRYPAHASAIAEYAAISLREALRRDVAADDVDEADILERLEGRSAQDLPALVRTSGSTVPRLAGDIGIDRGILADLIAGRIALPIPSRLTKAIAASLGVAVERVADALSRSFEQPRMGFANASEAPSARTTTLADALRDIGMSDERQAFWLGDD